MSNSTRGFAHPRMKERVSRIASMGGKAVRPQNRAYSKDRKLASDAGRKGGFEAAERRRMQ